MDALGFIELMERTHEPRYDELSAQKYFETDAGKWVAKFLVSHVNIINDRSFTLIDNGVVKSIERNAAYLGRSFFADMHELGFTCTEMQSYEPFDHDYAKKIDPIKVYLFEVK